MANQWKFMFPGFGIACALLMLNLAAIEPPPIKKRTRKIVSIYSERSFSRVNDLITIYWQLFVVECSYVD